MGFGNQAIYQTRILLNEMLRHVGVQIVKAAEMEELKSFMYPALAGARRTPEVFVETGTYLGNTTAAAARVFRKVHTIELSEELHLKAQARFRDVENITCHQGNSPDVLLKLVASIQEPAVFFLDAHWSGGVTAHGEVEVPLLEELGIIRNRNMDDVIIIDDLRLIGRSGKTGLRLSREYPISDFDWRDVTLDAILEALGRPKHIREYADKLIIDLKDSHSGMPARKRP